MIPCFLHFEQKPSPLGFGEGGHLRQTGGFGALTEFRGKSSVSSSQLIIYVPKRSHRVFRRTHRVCCRTLEFSMPNMTGRPGHRTMEMIGGSSAPYLARTPCVPLFCTSFNRVGNKERFRLPGAGGGSFPLYGGTFARSYSVSKFNSIPLVS